MAKLDYDTQALLNACIDKDRGYKHRIEKVITFLDKDKWLTDATAQRILKECREAKTEEIPYNLKGILKSDDELVHRITCLTYDQRQIVNKIKMYYQKTQLLEEKGMICPISVLLDGKPGTGKTLFAAELAKQLELPFFYLNVSNLVDCKVGETGHNLQRVFDFISTRNCVLMVDELDAIALSRSSEAQRHTEDTRVLVSLMQALDTLRSGNILISATNKPEMLDSAVKRRFQMHWTFDDLPMDIAISLVHYYMRKLEIEYDHNYVDDFIRREPYRNMKVNPSRLIQTVDSAIIEWYPDKVNLGTKLHQLFNTL